MRKRNRERETQTKIYIATLLFSLAFIFFGHQIASSGLQLTESAGGYYMKAKVTQIIDKVPVEDVYGDNDGYTITFRAMITSAEKKGIIVTAAQNYDTFVRTVGNDDVKVGDKVLLFNADLKSTTDWIFMSFIRSNYLIYFGAFFLILLLVFGQLKGLSTIVSLVFTVLAIFLVLVPAILNGHNIYVWSYLICVFIVVMSLIFIGGANSKTYAAILGCFGGILVSGLLLLLLDQFIHLTGVVSEESIFLSNIGTEPLDLKAVVFGAVTIGAIGAIMDTAMSIASSLYEVSEQSMSPTFGMLWKSGFAIGKDMMGTMTNTLILAYIGSSLALVLLLVAYNTPPIYLFNREMIVVEILQALIGSFGLLFTIPFTSLVCAKLYAKH